MNHSQVSQERHADIEMKELRENMHRWAIRQNSKRLKAICQAINEAIDAFKGNLSINETINPYKISRTVYNETIESITKAISAKFNRGICKEKQTKKNPDLFKQYQSYYMHNSPQNLCKWCYQPLLIDIADYIKRLSLENIETIHVCLSDDEIHELLKKIFIRNLMTGHLQMDKQSTKNGAIIQCKAWRELRLQKVINKYFDNAFESKWDQWMQIPNPNGKGLMRIDSIIKNKVAPFTKQQLEDCVNTLKSRHSISIKIRDFFVAAKEIEIMHIDNYIEDGSVSGIEDAPSLSMTLASCIDRNAGVQAMDDVIHHNLPPLPPLPPSNVIQNQPRDLQQEVLQELERENNKLIQELNLYRSQLRRVRMQSQALQSNNARVMNTDFRNIQMSRQVVPYHGNHQYHGIPFNPYGHFPSEPFESHSQSMITSENEHYPPCLSPSVSRGSNDTVMDDSFSQQYSDENNNQCPIIAPEVPLHPIPMQPPNGYQPIHGSQYNHIEYRQEPMSIYNRSMSLVPHLPGLVPSYNSFCGSVYADNSNNYNCNIDTVSNGMSYTDSVFDTNTL